MADEKIPVRISSPVRNHIRNHCPHCGYGPLNGATGLEIGARPQAGARPLQPKQGTLSLCARCGGFLVYDVTPLAVELSVRAATDADLVPYRADAAKWQVLATMVRVIKERGGVV